jgi:hypothetical protein
MGDKEVEADKEFGPTVDGVNKKSKKNFSLQVEPIRYIEIFQKADIF